MKNLLEKLEDILEIGTIENVTDRFKNRKPNPFSPLDIDLFLRVEKGETLYEFTPKSHPSDIECLISSSDLYTFIGRVWMYIQEAKQSKS